MQLQHHLRWNKNSWKTNCLVPASVSTYLTRSQKTSAQSWLFALLILRFAKRWRIPSSFKPCLAAWYSSTHLDSILPTFGTSVFYCRYRTSSVLLLIIQCCIKLPCSEGDECCSEKAKGNIKQESSVETSGAQM